MVKHLSGRNPLFIRSILTAIRNLWDKWHFWYIAIPYSSGQYFQEKSRNIVIDACLTCRNPLFVRSILPTIFYFDPKDRACKSQSLILQVNPFNKPTACQLKRFLQIVAIPYSSGQSFQHGRAISRTFAHSKSQSLIHQVNPSNRKFIDARLGRSSESRNPLFIRSILPTKLGDVVVTKSLIRRNPLFIRSILPTTKPWTWNWIKKEKSQSLIHQVNPSN